MTTDAKIESFIRSFEDGSLPRSGWTHAGHLIVALWYVRRHDRDRATGLIGTAFGATTSATNPTGYHETITLAWVAVIDRFLGERSWRLRLGARRGAAGRVRRERLPAAVLLQRAAVLRRGPRPLGAARSVRDLPVGAAMTRGASDMKPITFSCEATLARPASEQILDLGLWPGFEGYGPLPGSGRRSSRSGRPRSSAPASG